jgi:hypothetical protein
MYRHQSFLETGNSIILCKRNRHIGQLEGGGNGLDECGQYFLRWPCQGKLLIETGQHRIRRITFSIEQSIGGSLQQAPQRLEDDGHQGRGEERNQFYQDASPSGDEPASSMPAARPGVRGVLS